MSLAVSAVGDMPVFVPLLQQIVACICWFRGHGSLSWEPSPRVPPAAALFVCLLVRLRVALPLVTSVLSALGLRITVPSSGLAPAEQAWPSFHSGPILRRLREPLMSNVRRRKREELSQVQSIPRALLQPERVTPICTVCSLPPPNSSPESLCCIEPRPCCQRILWHCEQ